MDGLVKSAVNSGAQSADILWIICMSLIGSETPSDRAITVTIALEELEEKAAMLEGDASDAPPTA